MHLGKVGAKPRRPFYMTQNFQRIYQCEKPVHQAKVGAKHSSTISTRFGFSNAAATRSLSFNCLFTARNERDDGKLLREDRCCFNERKKE